MSDQNTALAPVYDLIVVEQLPVIRERLNMIKSQIQPRIDRALSLEVTEDSVKEVKTVRANLNKDFQALEAARIETKKKVMEPYLQFEEVYKEFVTDIFKPADAKLKRKVDEVEDKLKKEKELEVKVYFEECCSSHSIDFLSFAQLGLSVSLSASKKSLKEKAKQMVDKVAEELTFIEKQEHAAEVLVEYKKSLNVVQALELVSRRHKAVEEEIARKAAQEKKRALEQESVKKVEEAAATAAPLAPLNPVSEETDPIVRSPFVVIEPLSRVREVKKLLDDGGYYYE